LGPALLAPKAKSRLTADQSAAERFRVAVARPENRKKDRIQIPNEQSSNS
jgi:hypothetical protein